MSNLTTVEKQRLEDLFGMREGYVFKSFSTQRFEEFFRQDVGINIADPRYAYNGTSQAKRLRAFWEIEENKNVGKALEQRSGRSLVGSSFEESRRLQSSISESEAERYGEVRSFPEWTLANLIDVSYEVGVLRLDVMRFGHAVRDFRNYIHPYQQMASRFNPDQHTAQICMQVLRVALVGLKANRGMVKPV